MSGERPSNVLIALLAGSVALAGWVYGRPLVTGSEGPDETYLEPSDLGFVDQGGGEVDVQPWTPPASPRNPFLPVDLTATATPPDGGDPAATEIGDAVGG